MNHVVITVPVQMITVDGGKEIGAVQFQIAYAEEAAEGLRKAAEYCDDLAGDAAAMKKRKPITQRNACDLLFSKIVRARGYCARCGRTDRLECAHIIGRGQGAWTRTCLENAWALCTWCHRETHRDPLAFALLVEKTIGLDEYQRLRRRAEKGVGVKFDWFAERERLKRLHREIDGSGHAEVFA